MSTGKILDALQWEAGHAHKPSWLTEEENAQLMDGPDFAAHVEEAFRSGYGSQNFSEAKVRAAALAVMEDWQRSGETVEPTRDFAEKLAAATGNHLSGFRGGRGLGSMFGRVVEEPEAPQEERGAGADAAKWRREAGY